MKTELYNVNFQNEIWKDIKGYEGIYQVSSMGRVQSIDREVTQFCHKKYFTRTISGKIIKPGVQNSGYEIVWLSKNGEVSPFLVHRLVASAFLNIEKGKSDVNHKDGNRRNNTVRNLEWCTKSENVKHSYQKLNHKRKGKLIRCIELDRCFLSAAEASRVLGINAGGIRHAISGVAKTAGGYTWERM